MTFAMILRFLVPALEAVLPMVPAGTPAGALAQVVLKLLPSLTLMQAQMHAFGATPTAALPHPADLPPLPPQSEWTREGLTAWAEHYPDPDRPSPPQ